MCIFAIANGNVDGFVMIATTGKNAKTSILRTQSIFKSFAV